MKEMSVIRPKVTTHPSTCWPVLVELAVNTHVRLLDPWGWRRSLSTCKDIEVCSGKRCDCTVTLCAGFRYSGVLSAYGLALADVVEEVQEPCSLQYTQESFSELDRRMEQLSKRCHDTLCARGFKRSVKKMLKNLEEMNITLRLANILLISSIYHPPHLRGSLKNCCPIFTHQ